jgi:hypothetical protein
MDKKILISSIGSVAGFLAIFISVVYLIALGLSTYPNTVLVVLFVAAFAWMIKSEYKDRIAKRNLKVATRINDLIKK